MILQFADPALIKWCLGFVKQGAEEAGRDFSKIRVMSATAVWISEDKKIARERVGRHGAPAGLDRPDRLIIQNPHRTKNLGASHRDHRTVAGIALDCVYPLARDHMAFPELLAQGLEPHKVREVYLMWWENPELVVDISDTIDLKIKALACHASQFKDFTGVEKRVRERGAELGKPKGYAYAETFDLIALDR